MGANINQFLPQNFKKDSDCSLLLFLGSSGTSLDWCGGGDCTGGLVVLGNGQSLAISGKSEEGTATLSANVAVGMLSHVSGGRAVGALLLELLDLA